MNTAKTQDNQQASANSYAAELTAAFEKADLFVRQERNNSPLEGFGRGGELGNKVLRQFMPQWFQKWMMFANWHSAGLLQGEKGWWSYVKAFGLSKDEWWEQVLRHNGADRL